ncbi:MAG TPA: response regulator [Candidatus Mediterraneibacter vanvlietii]|nr:response regulator [Candidatus Mediterraneibacter vanvlietii]
MKSEKNTRGKRLSREKEALYGLQRKILSLIVFAAIAAVSLVVIRGILLDNAQRMGNEMAHSYSAEGERNLTAYETLMQVTTEYIDNQLESSGDPEGRIQMYLQMVSHTLGDNVIDPYVVIDGKIIAANPWEGDEEYDIYQTEWYQKAMEADGEIIYTDGYKDAITGETIVTIAKKSKEGTVASFDINPSQFRRNVEDYDNLPEGSAYFLCDSSGQLLYEETESEVSRDALQQYMDILIGKIEDGDFPRTNAYVHNPAGEKRAAYYDVAGNGWISIITMPYNSLLQGVQTLSIWFLGILVIFLVALVILTLRENKMTMNYRRTNETVRVLGNSYYAIYRVDFASSTYEMIKGSDYVRERIPVNGDYELLLKIAGEVMRADVFQDFRVSFSIDNIRKLVAGRTRDYGGDFLRKFGDEYRWVNVRVLFDESLNPEEAVLCFREVDEEKKAQLKQIQLLRESLQTAKESEESKNSFFSNMSHDMRTPLNAIIGLSELAQKHIGDPEKVREYMRKINYSSQQLLSLINDILEMSRMGSGKLSMTIQHFNLKKCIQDCVDIFQSQAEQQEKKFSVDIEMHTTEVYGDSFRLTQVLNNLLSNAVKFTKPGDRIALTVREIEQSEYTKYQIVVEDTGAGMSEEFLDKIFIPYERETRFGARNIAGTGLGMPITKNIISQMNGEISVESELDRGSRFTVTLPFKGIRNGENKEDQRRGSREDGKKPEQQEEDFLKGKKILLAEDNEINMEIACELLSMYGAEIVKAWNGREAVDAFHDSEENEFYAILMDMQMPEMDGCEAARLIRKMRRNDAKSVPIIAVTANAFAEDLAATSAAGMNAHVSKPIDFKVLCRTLRELDQD